MVTLLVRYRSRDVFRVGSLCLPPSRGISNPRYSGTPGLSLLAYPYGAVTLYGAAFQPTSGSPFGSTGVQTPHLPCLSAKDSVCPVPFSLSVTRGISFDFSSCGYLDVSVLRVPTPDRSAFRQEVPFRHLRFLACMQLAGAYRSLPRPSSAPKPSLPPDSLVSNQACLCTASLI